MLNLLDRSYPDVVVSVINNLRADIIVGQELLKQHRSATLEIQGSERFSVIPGHTSNPSGRLAVTAAKLAPRDYSSFCYLSANQSLAEAGAQPRTYSVYQL